MPINIIDEGNCFAIWYDTELQERNGLCIAYAKTRNIAIKRAIKELESELTKLRTIGEESGK